MIRVLFLFLIASAGCITESEAMPAERGLADELAAAVPNDQPDAAGLTGPADSTITISAASFGNAFILTSAPPLRATPNGGNMYMSLPLHAGDRITSAEVSCVGGPLVTEGSMAIIRSAALGVTSFHGEISLFHYDPSWFTYELPIGVQTPLTSNEALTLRVGTIYGLSCSHVSITYDRP